jgi:hypothetical protein
MSIIVILKNSSLLKLKTTFSLTYLNFTTFGCSYSRYFDLNNNQVTDAEGYGINAYNYESDILLHEV